MRVEVGVGDVTEGLAERWWRWRMWVERVDAGLVHVVAGVSGV